MRLYYGSRNQDESYSAMRHQINQIACRLELCSADDIGKLELVIGRLNRILMQCDVALPEWYQLVTFKGMDTQAISTVYPYSQK
jgi:hypothetical protein